MQGANSTAAGQHDVLAKHSYTRSSQRTVSKRELTEDKSQGYPLLITLLIMGLLAEWLNPLHHFSSRSTDPYFLSSLYVLTALLLMIGWLVKKTPIAICLQMITSMVVWYFFSSGENWLVWLPHYLVQLQDDAQLFLQDYSIARLSLETRTWIVMLGWGIFASCVHAVAMYLRSILLLGVLTVIYLLCLEAMADVSVYTGMLRVILLLAVLQGVLHFSRLEDYSPLRQRRQGMGWFLTASALVLLTAGLSVQAVRLADVPAADHQAIDQLAVKLHSWQKKSSGQGLRETVVTGYGEGMREMGAALQPDYTPVFTAESPLATYWRGESYSYYTGRRWDEPYAQWETEEVGKQYIADQDVEEDGSRAVMANEGEAAMASPSIIQHIRYVEPVMTGLPLFAGGTITKVIDVESHQETRQPVVYRDQASEAVKLPVVTSAEAITGYVIETRLNPVLEGRLPALAAAEPSWVTDRYLQLPERLPDRVKKLGAELVAEPSDRYDAALRVQSYLRENYSYSLNTKVPAPGQEFTDDFLFESREGYCNHFSTAMVVLLRSQGIPARFVKGYAPGQPSESDPTQFVITQADAHSWVEVYFPGAGWVAFDPTPGFAMNASSVSDLQTDVLSSSPVLVVLQKVIGEWSHKGQVLVMEAASQVSVMLRTSWLSLLGGFAALCCGAWSLAGLYRSRDYIALLRANYLSSRAFPSKVQLVDAGMRVWRVLSRQYGSPESGATAREYLDSLVLSDERLAAELEVFTRQWEGLMYSEEAPDRTASRMYLKRCLHIIRSLP